MKLVLGVGLAVILLGGCRTIEFVGDEYPSTNHVNLFCSWQDVHESYRVIGHFVPEDNDMTNIPKMRQQMLKAARKIGANAIVIVGAGPCSDDTENVDSRKTQALRAHQVQISLLRYRVSKKQPVDTTEISKPDSTGRSG